MKSTRKKTKYIVNALPLSLLRARESVIGRFRDLVRHYDLTEPQWRVLRTIGGLKQVELGELTRITVLLLPSLSRIIRDLELRGYITRIAHPSDQRRCIVALTAQGNTLVAQIMPGCEAVYSGIGKALGQDKLRQLHGLLLELETRLERLDAKTDLPLPPANEAPGAALGRRGGRTARKRAAE